MGRNGVVWESFVGVTNTNSSLTTTHEIRQMLIFV